MSGLVCSSCRSKHVYCTGESVVTCAACGHTMCMDCQEKQELIEALRTHIRELELKIKVLEARPS